VLVLGAAIVFLLTQPPSGGTTPPPATPNPDALAGAATMGAGNLGSPVVAAGGGVTIPGETAVPSLSRDHTSDPITYKELPPLGGAHWNDWINCGIYDQPVQNEQAVHSLEHGAIWITYQPTMPMDQVEKLRAIVRQSGYRLMSPYFDLPHPLVVSAWGYQLPLDSVDDPRLAQFIQRHEQDPKGPEPGASCSGSIGAPLP
jgi:hypothetical protein